MKKVTLLYRDGNNYKSVWDVEMTDEAFGNLPEPEDLDYYPLSAFGLTLDDVPLIQEFGFNSEVDSPYVVIYGVENI